MILVLSSYNIKELFKNSVRKKYFKKLHKGKFITSSPFFRQVAPKFVYMWNHAIAKWNKLDIILVLTSLLLLKRMQVMIWKEYIKVRNMNRKMNITLDGKRGEGVTWFCETGLFICILISLGESLNGWNRPKVSKSKKLFRYLSAIPIIFPWRRYYEL